MSSTSGGRIEIAYGRSHLAVDLPPEAEATVIRKRDLPRIADPAAAIAGRCVSSTGSRSGRIGPVAAIPAPATASWRTRIGWMALRMSSKG